MRILSHVVVVYIFRTTQLLLFSTLLKVGASVLGLKLGQLSRKCEELIGKCLIFTPVIVTEYLVKALFRVLYNSRTPTNCMSHFFVVTIHSAFKMQIFKITK